MAEESVYGAVPHIVARYLGNETMMSTIGVAPGPTGPWSYITGIPNVGSETVGPAPQYLAVAAWAA